MESTQGLRDQPIRGQHLIRPDGTISLGIYGSVHVAGLTIEQARMAIAAVLGLRIKDFDPRNLYVDVLSYNSKVYYVITDGGGYGEQVYRVPVTGSETVLDAISQINGLPPVASKRRIWLARRTPGDGGGPGQTYPVDWRAITQQGLSATNYQVLPGDRIYVKADCLMAIDAALAKFLSPVQRILGTTLLGGATVNNHRWQRGPAAAWAPRPSAGNVQRAVFFGNWGTGGLGNPTPLADWEIHPRRIRNPPRGPADGGMIEERSGNRSFVSNSAFLVGGGRTHEAANDRRAVPGWPAHGEQSLVRATSAVYSAAEHQSIRHAAAQPMAEHAARRRSIRELLPRGRARVSAAHPQRAVRRANTNAESAARVGFGLRQKWMELLPTLPGTGHGTQFMNASPYFALNPYLAHGGTGGIGRKPQGRGVAGRGR